MNRDNLITEIKARKSFLCVGLDTDIDRIPKHLLDTEDPVFEFNKAIIDATKNYCVAYKPNIALLSGIAWDHINVFPTFENYKAQFQIFTDSMINGGSMVYNVEDENVKDVVESSENHIKKYPYETPSYFIDNGTTYLETTEGDLPLEIFGKHNLQNLAGAKWICQHMRIDEDDFYEAIASFSGASKRLEKIAENDTTVIFKDFAHSPSTVSYTHLTLPTICSV